MSKAIWVQTTINFREYHKSKLEIEYHKTYKTRKRFYTLYFLNNFVTRNNNSNWFSNTKRIEKKIKEKDTIHKYITKMWLSA